MNEQDSLQMRGLLSDVGYQKAADEFEADLILFVTCSIREKAVHKVYSELGKLRPLVETNPNLIVGVAGCVAQQEKANLFKRYPFLDLVFGPDAISELPSLVLKVQTLKKKGSRPKVLRTQFHSKKDFQFVNLIADGEENRVRAFVTIQKGCDNVCAFCIVPRVRGGEVSRPSAQIIDEIKTLVDMGVKEVTLLGQNVNSYGLKDHDELSFAELLRKISRETPLQRLRFTTSHPKDVGDDLVNCFRDLEILCPHFHLPVQSGSNRILEAMRRHYTVGHYLEMIQKLKKVRPELVFSTDFIVGFPGESACDFEDTLFLLETVGFDASYSFAYSPRPGTTASRLSDDVSDGEKAARLEVLLARQRQISARQNLAFEETLQKVLVERRDEPGDHWMGRTGTNKIVHIKAGVQSGSCKTNEDDLTGKLVSVFIHKANPHSLMGEVKA